MIPESTEQTVWQGRPSALLDLPFYLLLLVGAIIASLGLLFLLPAPGTASVSGRSPTADVFKWIIAAVWVVCVGLGLARWVTRRATQYVLTSERLRITTGVLSTVTEDMELRRIRDSAVSRPFSLRIVGLGDVRISSADPSTPRTTLQAIRDPDRVQDMLRRLVEQRVRQQGVREIDIM